MICRVAYKVVTGQGAEDTRSDDEGCVLSSPVRQLLTYTEHSDDDDSSQKDE